MHKPPQWHKNHPQWHTKYLQTSTNSLKNFHKYTKTSTMTHKTSTKRLKIFTMTQPLQTSTNSHKPPKIHKKLSQNPHKTCTKRRETTTALLSHLAGDGWLKGRITKTKKTSQTVETGCVPVLYKGDQTWLICLQSPDGHCWFLQNESSQELKVLAEEQAAEDELEDGFLNWILISSNQVLWTDMFSGWCSFYQIIRKCCVSCKQFKQYQFS